MAKLKAVAPSWKQLEDRGERIVVALEVGGQLPNDRSQLG
jgi:hypothetical protein